jgi:hypothetical protein
MTTVFLRLGAIQCVPQIEVVSNHIAIRLA